MAKAIKVLIVEDDTQILDVYKKKFELSKFEVFTAQNGVEGVKATKEHHPDIILLDVMMPTMNGFEAIEKIKKDKDTADIPVIFLSNYGEVDQMTEGFVNGAVDYLIKAEHTPSDVVNIVKDTLENNNNLIAPAFDE
jgi:two-component system alkaline phosphatase synthesis response regulator PhoP